MKLIRYDYPTRPAASDLDRFFNEFWGSFPRFGNMFESAVSTPKIAADLYEDDSNVYARFELPGFKKEEISIELENAVLSVNVERKGDEKGAGALSASRSVTLPDGINAEDVSASYEDGILTVTLAKSPELKPRTIAIK